MNHDPNTPSQADHVDRTFRTLFEEGRIGAHAQPATIYLHRSAPKPVLVTPRQAVVAATVRAKFAAPDPGLALERENAIYLLTTLADRYTLPPLQQTLSLVLHFGAEIVQGWLATIAAGRGEQ